MRVFVGSVLTFIACSVPLNAGDASAPVNLLSPEGQQVAWRLDQSDGCKGAVKDDKGAIQFVVMHADKAPAQIQAFLGDLDLSDGKSYTISGKIKGSRIRSILLTATIDEDDWHGIGLHEKINVTSEYQPFEYTFRVSDTVRRKNRLGFVIGQEIGTIWVRDFSLHCK